VAGGIMPAIGFAVLLKIMMKNVYIPYFIIGFVAAAWLKLPVLAIAAAALAMALIDLLRKSPEPTAPRHRKRNSKMASNQTTLPGVSESEETLLTGVNENVYEDQNIGAELTKKILTAWPGVPCCCRPRSTTNVCRHPAGCTVCCPR
jgi:PTS system N-acetylgalactosamine-specific IIC component